MKVLKQDKKLGVSLRQHTDGRYSVRVERPATGAVIEERRFTSLRSATSYYISAVSSAGAPNPLSKNYGQRRWYR